MSRCRQRLRQLEQPRVLARRGDEREPDGVVVLAHRDAHLGRAGQPGDGAKRQVTESTASAVRYLASVATRRSRSIEACQRASSVTREADSKLARMFDAKSGFTARIQWPWTCHASHCLSVVNT